MIDLQGNAVIISPDEAAPDYGIADGTQINSVPVQNPADYVRVLDSDIVSAVNRKSPARRINDGYALYRETVAGAGFCSIGFNQLVAAGISVSSVGETCS